MSAVLRGVIAAGGGGPAPASYVGPGDVVSGAAAWWGLRAYSAAMAGTAAVRLRRDSDDTEQDFNTLANGSLDLASIITFKGAANVFVVNLYDQSGNSRDIAQATAGRQPQFILSTIGSLPAIFFIAASSTRLETFPTTFSAAQPFTYSQVSERTAVPGSYAGYAANNNGGLLSPPSADQVLLYTGGNISALATAADNAFHAIQAVADGAASVIAVDGTETSTDPGSSTGIAGGNNIGVWSGTYLDGYIAEQGIWAAGFSSGERTAMNANQHAYWGF